MTSINSARVIDPSDLIVILGAYLSESRSQPQGPDNFTIRKYRRQSLATVVDPVIACVNILRRAHILAIPKNEPVGKFRKSKGRNDCLPAKYHLTNNSTRCLAY